VLGRKLFGGVLERMFIKGEASSFTLPGVLGEEGRVLAVGDGDLSELFFHVPLLRTIRSRFPRSRIDFLVPEPLPALIAPSGLARDCFVFDQGGLRVWNPSWYGLLKKVRGIGYDMCLVMAREPDSRLESIALASGAPLRIGPSHEGAYPAVNLELRPRDPDKIYHGARLEALAPFLDLPVFAGDRSWPLPDERLRRARQLVHFNKPRQEELLLGVDPALGKGGGGIALKNLHFVISQLASQMSCRVVPLSLDPDGGRLAEFTAGLERSPLDLKTESLFDVLVHTAVCDLFLSGNTDLFHYAAGQGIPSLGLFMPEDGQRWVPDRCPNVGILRGMAGERLDIDTLIRTVETVRGAG